MNKSGKEIKRVNKMKIEIGLRKFNYKEIIWEV